MAIIIFYSIGISRPSFIAGNQSKKTLGAILFLLTLYINDKQRIEHSKCDNTPRKSNYIFHVAKSSKKPTTTTTTATEANKGNKGTKQIYSF